MHAAAIDLFPSSPYTCLIMRVLRLCVPPSKGVEEKFGWETKY